MAALSPPGEGPGQAAGPAGNGWLHAAQDGEGEQGKRTPHPAEIKSEENALLAKARAIKLSRQKPVPNLADELPKRRAPEVYAHWDYVMYESQWLARDMAQEKIWKKKVAFYFANLIASSNIRLRPVKRKEDEERKDDEEELDRNAPGGNKRASRAAKGGVTARSKRASKAKRTASMKSEGDEENEDVGKEEGDSARRLSHDGNAPRVPPPPEAVLTYNFNSKWPQYVRDYIVRKNDEIVISKLIQWQEYEAEYEANRQAVEEFWQDNQAKRAQQRAHMAANEADVEDVLPERARGRVRKAHLYDDASLANDTTTSTSQLDENGDNPDISSRRPRPKRQRHAEQEMLMRNNRRMGGMVPSMLSRQPLGQSWENEDDRLLCSIMSEFGENSALVADVYVSTRRLEGIHCDATQAEQRIRQMVENQNGGTLTPDFPMPKNEAREFLQQSIPCMASVVMRYQAAIQPMAEQVVRERELEEKNVGQKKAEYMLHKQIMRHPSHNRFMTEANSAYNGVVFPKQMVEIMRGNVNPAQLRQPSIQYAPQQLAANAAAVPHSAPHMAAVPPYQPMQAGGPDAMHSQQSFTQQQVQAMQQHQQKQMAAQYAAQAQVPPGSMNSAQANTGGGMPMPAVGGAAHAGGMPANGAMQHMARAPGGGAVMPPQYQQMARPPMHGQRPQPTGAASLPGYVLPGGGQPGHPARAMQPQERAAVSLPQASGLAQHGMRPMPAGDPQLSGAPVAMSAPYLVGAPGAPHQPQVVQVAMQHMQDALGSNPGNVPRLPHNSGMPPAMQIPGGQGGPRPGPGSQPLNLPPAPS